MNLKTAIVFLLAILCGLLLGIGFTYNFFIKKRIDGSPWCQPYKECYVTLPMAWVEKHIPVECDADKSDYEELADKGECEKLRDPSDGSYISSVLYMDAITNDTWMRKTYWCPSSGNFRPSCTVKDCDVFLEGADYKRWNGNGTVGNVAMSDKEAETWCQSKYSSLDFRWWYCTLIVFFLWGIYIFPADWAEHAFYHRNHDREAMAMFVLVFLLITTFFALPSSPMCTPFWCMLKAPSNYFTFGVVVVLAIMLVPSELLAGADAVPKPFDIGAAKAKHPGLLQMQSHLGDAEAAHVTRVIRNIHFGAGGSSKVFHLFYSIIDVFRKSKKRKLDALTRRLASLSDFELNVVLQRINVGLLFICARHHDHPIIRMMCTCASNVEEATANDGGDAVIHTCSFQAIVAEKPRGARSKTPLGGGGDMSPNSISLKKRLSKAPMLSSKSSEVYDLSSHFEKAFRSSFARRGDPDVDVEAQVIEIARGSADARRESSLNASNQDGSIAVSSAKKYIFKVKLHSKKSLRGHSSVSSRQTLQTLFIKAVSPPQASGTRKSMSIGGASGVSDLDVSSVRIYKPQFWSTSGRRGSVGVVEGRLGALSPLSRAIVIDGLRKRTMGLHKTTQRYVLNIFEATRAQDMILLKSLIDHGGNYFTLHKLVYKDMRSKSMRKSLIRTIHRESLKGKPLKRSTTVFSDVDDTLYSSGGHWPAGVDKAVPKHVVYPGCLAFFKVLFGGGPPDEEASNVFKTRSFVSETDWDDIGETACMDTLGAKGSLVFLSARPHAYKDAAETASYEAFRALVNEGKLDFHPVMLPGALPASLRSSFFSLIFKVFRRDAKRATQAWKGAGIVKYKTFKEYVGLFPENRVVFCGDNGQADGLLAELIAEPALALGHKTVRSSFSERDQITKQNFGGAFIHRVQNIAYTLTHHPMRSGSATLTDPPAAEEWMRDREKEKIHVFGTYVEAAIEAYLSEAQCIDIDGLFYVAQEAVWDTWTLCIDYPRWMHSAGREYIQSIIDDCQKVTHIIQESAREYIAQGGHGTLESLALAVDVYPLRALLAEVEDSLRSGSRQSNRFSSRSIGEDSSAASSPGSVEEGGKRKSSRSMWRTIRMMGKLRDDGNTPGTLSKLASLRNLGSFTRKRRKSSVPAVSAVSTDCVAIELPRVEKL